MIERIARAAPSAPDVEAVDGDRRIRRKQAKGGRPEIEDRDAQAVRRSARSALAPAELVVASGTGKAQLSSYVARSDLTVRRADDGEGAAPALAIHPPTAETLNSGATSYHARFNDDTEIGIKKFGAKYVYFEVRKWRGPEGGADGSRMNVADNKNGYKTKEMSTFFYRECPAVYPYWELFRKAIAE